MSRLEPALGRAAYLDAAVWALERERIFATEWSVVCRASDAPDTGDWFLGAVGGESPLVVRGDAGVARLPRGADAPHAPGGGMPVRAGAQPL